MSDTTAPAFQVGQTVRIRDGSPPALVARRGAVHTGPHPDGCYHVRMDGDVAWGHGLVSIHESHLRADDALAVSGVPVAIATAASVPLNDGSGDHTVKAVVGPSWGMAEPRLSDTIIANSGLVTAAQLDTLMQLLGLTQEERAFVRSALAADRDASFWPKLVDFLAERGGTDGIGRAAQHAVCAAMGEVADCLDGMAGEAHEEEHLGLTIAAQFVRGQAR